ncbi:M14 family metallopeptidase [Litchfieldia alkalitelluris]|uniref:M14 family metallopeptidase n=1 Tax=Litchfieldia alkalitelluris TaxID=304268 RepID=UPI0009978465|nr:M14 family metallopeptidase [Litchfieldia alkalitelluris]
MKDLKEIWKIGSLVKDQNNDGVPDASNVSIQLTEDVKAIGLIDFAARIGFETTAISFDFFNQENTCDWLISFEKSEEETACVVKPEGLLFVYKNEGELNRLLQYMAHHWPSDFPTSDPVIKLSYQSGEFSVFTGTEVFPLSVPKDTTAKKEYLHIQSLSDFWNGIGFLNVDEASPFNETNVSFEFLQPCSNELLQEACYLAARIGMMSTSLHFPLTDRKELSGITFQFDGEEEGIFFDPESQILQFKGNQAVGYFARATHFSEGGSYLSWEKEKVIQPVIDEEPMLHLTWEDQGEKERVLELCQLQASMWQEEDQLDIEIFLSEPKDVRQEVNQQLKSLFPKCRSVKVRSAFKPAYCWIEEDIVPLLKDEEIGKIVIECIEDSLPGLELPIRWIQELYPIDLLLERELNISAEDVEFTLVENSQSTYSFIAYNSSGEVLLEERLTVPVAEYEYVEKGKKVYPTTGQLKISRLGKTLFEEILMTDRERFYQYYQQEVLELLYSKIERKEEGQGFTMPLFDRIEVSVTMSEEEKKLDLDEERISSMEALHEDVYFNTLDFFMQKGEEEKGKGFTAPGGVHPYMRAVKHAKPFAEIIAYPWKPRVKEKWVTEQITFSQYGQPAFALVKEIHSGKTATIPITLPVQKKSVSNFHIREWYPSVSYRGKKLQVLEVTAEINEEFYSPLKLTAYKPTIFIEAGHHANEVSSTPAILQLITEFMSEKKEILQKVNLVVLPIANPDGLALHQRMAADNPEWKHHAARYNAVGLEHRNVLYQDTEFGEADVIPAIMKKWAPDVIIDDHGIPSHEWVQPFAGYNSPPRFPVSYWMPNALIYGIGRELQGEAGALHVENLQTIIKSVQNKLAGTDIEEKNKYWMKRYKKYGHQWLPEVFPLENHENLIFYTWKTEPSPASTSAVARYPEWVAADIISEAADETVYGEVLQDCIRGHQLFDLAIMETMIQHPQEIKHVVTEEKREVYRDRPIQLNEVE